MFSVEYIYSNLKIAGENWWVKGDTETSMGGTRIKTDGDNKDPSYVSIGYRFFDWFESSFYYSRYQDDDLGDGDDAELTDYCASLRFVINYNWLAKLEPHVMEGKYGVSPDDDGHTYSEWMLYAVKAYNSF